jgi:hypothetical protein
MTNLNFPAVIDGSLRPLMAWCNRSVKEAQSFFWRNLPALPKKEIKIILSALVHDLLYVYFEDKSPYIKEEIPPADVVHTVDKFLNSAKQAAPVLIKLFKDSAGDHDLEYNLSVILMLLGNKYPEVVRPAIPIVARRLNELMDKNQTRKDDDPIHPLIEPEVGVIIVAIEIFSAGIAESRVDLLRPIIPLLQKARQFPEKHVQQYAGEILEKLGIKAAPSPL